MPKPIDVIEKFAPLKSANVIGSGVVNDSKSGGELLAMLMPTEAPMPLVHPA